MGDALVDELMAGCRGEVTPGAPLSALTTLRVGGPVRALVRAESDEDLAVVGRAAEAYGVPTLVVGRGSNLLIGDLGWDGIAIVLGRGFRGVEIDPASGRVRAGAAEPLPALSVRVADAGLGGFAWAAAVPGSLGGAVRMNAGAHGGEMSQALVEVEVFRLGSRVREVWAPSALGLRYRHSDLPTDGVVVAATLAFESAAPDEVRDEIAEIRAWRREHQPLNEPNCGSVFTNPPGDSAGRLIDAAGAKGLRIGGAQVSERHANFIVTQPGARAADVLALIDEVRTRVRESAGIDLVPEVVVRGTGAW